MIQPSLDNLGGSASPVPVFLTAAQLRDRCPAAFATKPHSRCSENYKFVSTADIVTQMRTEHGFEVTDVKNPMRKVKGKDCSTLELSTTGAHMLTFEPRKPIEVGGEGRARVILINSHDRSKRLTLAAGFIRLVCANGLIMGANKVAVKATHLISSMKEIDDQIKAVLRHAGHLEHFVGDMRATNLTSRQQTWFAKSAAEIRWGKNALIDPKLLLAPRRDEDAGDDLWRVFNRVQENLIKGGIRRDGSPMATFPVTRPRQDYKVNAGLWELAESYLS